MIHSLAGGTLGAQQYLDFAKVEIIEGAFKGDIYWYISKISTLKAGDEVLVPFGRNDTLTKGRVLRVDKHVSSQVAPIPVRRAKNIVKIL